VDAFVHVTIRVFTCDKSLKVWKVAYGKASLFNL